MLSEDTKTLTTGDSTSVNLTNDSNANSQQMLDDIAHLSVSAYGKTALLSALIECSESVGGYVQLLSQMSYMPALIGNDGQPVFLYQVVEMLEGCLDFDALLEEFPTLNYTQIIGALSFLRKVAQINSRQVNLDELEDELEANDDDFIHELRNAFEARENNIRVFTEAV